jgi:hypothetical protein
MFLACAFLSGSNRLVVIALLCRAMINQCNREILIMNNLLFLITREYVWLIDYFWSDFCWYKCNASLYLHKLETNACETNYVSIILPYLALTCRQDRCKFYRILLLCETLDICFIIIPIKLLNLKLIHRYFSIMPDQLVISICMYVFGLLFMFFC